jgi:hypothetical protein
MSGSQEGSATKTARDPSLFSSFQIDNSVGLFGRLLLVSRPFGTISQLPSHPGRMRDAQITQKMSEIKRRAIIPGTKGIISSEEGAILR